MIIRCVPNPASAIRTELRVVHTFSLKALLPFCPVCCQGDLVGLSSIVASGAMVHRCKACGQRARNIDRSCGNAGCSSFRPPQRGRHWEAKRINSNRPLAPVYNSLGAFVEGGSAFSLLHRHDIRVAIAFGMLLKALIFDKAKRLELMAVLHPFHWRWSTKWLLIPI